jgi:hypothetical protein
MNSPVGCHVIATDQAHVEPGSKSAVAEPDTLNCEPVTSKSLLKLPIPPGSYPNSNL